MKKTIILILVGFVLSVAVFAEKKPKKTKNKVKKADTTIVLKDQCKIDSVKNDVIDSLQICVDTQLQHMKAEKELVIPNLDAFLERLMEGDTIAAYQDVMEKFRMKVINDISPLHLQKDSVRRQFVIFNKSKDEILQIQQVLSIPYNANKIDWAEQQLNVIETNKLPSYMLTRMDFLAKGIKYYKNKMAIRRVGDIIDELYELRADTVVNNVDSVKLEVRDSLFKEIIFHQGRNRLIDYVPYAATLRKKLVDAFPYDEKKHILLEQAKWKVVEAVKKEIETILEQ